MWSYPAFPVVVLAACAPHAQLSAPDTPPTITAYAMNLDDTGPPSCTLPFEGDTRCPAVTAPGVPLDSQQRSRLLTLLTDRRTFGEPEPKCFIPHHAFVVRDATGEILQQVAVCFLCENLRSSPTLPAQPENPARSALSPTGLTDLQALCHELGLPRCDGNRP